MITRSKAAKMPAKRKAEDDDIGPFPKAQKSTNGKRNNNKSDTEPVSTDKIPSTSTRSSKRKSDEMASVGQNSASKHSAAASDGLHTNHGLISHPTTTTTSTTPTTSPPKPRATPKPLPPFSMKTRSSSKSEDKDISPDQEPPATPPQSRQESTAGDGSGVMREADNTATNGQTSRAPPDADPVMLPPPTPAMTSEEPEPAKKKRKIEHRKPSPEKENPVAEMLPNGNGNAELSTAMISISQQKQTTSKSPPSRIGLRSGIKRKRSPPNKCFENDGQEVRQAKAKSEWIEPELADDNFLQRPTKINRRRRLTTPPDTPLHIFFCGDGGSGELGMGIAKHDGHMPVEVKTPRRNYLLFADSVGVVEISCGKQHCIALTKDNKILTWGWNGDGALGRETNHDPASEDQPNSAEFTPTSVDLSRLDEDIIWAQVVATDCASFALAADGRVFGWGTFKFYTEGQGFSHGVSIQHRPALIENLQDITVLAAGSQHVLAIDAKCTIYSWGCNSHSQLGRRPLSTNSRRISTSSSATFSSQTSCLRPKAVAKLPDLKSRAWQIACGSRHSFAVDQDGLVYAWGSNTRGQLGIQELSGSAKKFVSEPRLVEALKGKCVTQIAGGRAHSVACTTEGHLFTWGQQKHNALGLHAGDMKRGKYASVGVPTAVEGMSSIKAVAAGRHHSIAVDKDGLAFTFGRSKSWETGQGTTTSVVTPKPVECPDLEKMNVLFANGGEDFSVFAAVPMDG